MQLPLNSDLKIITLILVLFFDLILWPFFIDEILDKIM